MRKILFCTLVTFYSYTCAFAQKLESYTVYNRVQGYINAASAIEDTLSPGGFGESSNYPKQLNDSIPFKENGFFLKIDTLKSTAFGNRYNGYALYIVNNADSIIQLMAVDSKLSAIAEAFIDKQWKPIELLPSSFCGNSYHNVYLKPRQYWEFPVPKYVGRTKTKIRYKLIVNDTVSLYSNEVNGSINKKFLDRKQKKLKTLRIEEAKLQQYH